MIDIRPALSSEAPAISPVHVETWRSAYRGIVADEFLDAMSVKDCTEDWLDVLEHPEQATFVASAAGRGIVGFANGGPERDGRTEGRGELYGLYIVSEWQGQGIGRRLVGAFTRWLVRSGFDSMVVWVLADNPDRRFYERLGGKLIGEKEIVIGNQTLVEVAYGWDGLGVLAEQSGLR